MKYIVLFIILIMPFSVFAADPMSGEVSVTSPQVSWTGGPLVSTASATCVTANNPQCDNFTLTITPPNIGSNFNVEIIFSASPLDDYDMEVFDPLGNLVGSSGNSGSNEKIVLNNPVAGNWTVSAVPYLVIGPYNGVANFIVIEGSSGGGNVTTSPNPFMNYGPPGANGEDTSVYGPASGESGVGLGAGEPTMGIPVVSNITLQQTNPTLSQTMFIAGLETLRVTYDDCTAPAVAEWLDKSVPTHVNTLDPILETNQETGRTYSSQLQGKISLTSFSDDNGETWTQSQGNGINSGVDHQTVGSGPFSANDPLVGTATFGSAVYYASQDIAIAQLSASHDGGLTYGLAVPMYNITECGGLHGHIEVSPDGTIYVPNKSCNSEQGMARSTDGGTTFTTHSVPGTGSGSSDPSIGTSSDETIYLGMCNNGTTPQISVSQDKGDNWTTPVDVGSPFNIVNCAFPEVIAGDGDRAAFAFLGTATPGLGTSANPDFDGVWHMYVSFTYDRGMNWNTSIVTPGDPVQRGAVCLSGTTCESGRNMLDFNDIEIDEKGRVLIAYSDGCVGSCVNGTSNSFTDIARMARQQRGTKSLYAAFDSFMLPPLPGIIPDNPYVQAFNFIDTNQISWQNPFDGGSAITSYNIYRDDGAGEGSYSLLNTLPPTQLSYTDSDNVLGFNFCYKVLAENINGESSGCFETCAEAPQEINVCDLPGLVRANEVDDIAVPDALDILKLSVAEPFLGDHLNCGIPSEEKLYFTLNIVDGTTVASGNAWIILWNRRTAVANASNTQTYDRHMVSIRMDAFGPQCHYGMVTAPSVNQGDDLSDPFPAENCTLKQNGNTWDFKVVLDKSLIVDDCVDGVCGPIDPSNFSLDGLAVRTYQSNQSGALVSQGTSVDYATALSYDFQGNNSCRLDLEPTANPDVDISFSQPISISVLDNDTANDCDTLSITSIGVGAFGTTSIDPSGTSITYSPTAIIEGEEGFNYEITDSSGNKASAVITIIQGIDVMFQDGFEDI